MTTKKSTIKNDPFALVIPTQEEEREEAPPPGSAAKEQGRGGEPKPAAASPAAHKKEKLTVHLTHDLIERVKNAAYWNPRLTIAAIAERGIIQVIEQIEQENGGAYPPRESELKGGRPIGSASAGKTPAKP